MDPKMHQKLESAQGAEARVLDGTENERRRCLGDLNAGQEFILKFWGKVGFNLILFSLGFCILLGSVAYDI